ncbi:MAG: hypothetical protein ACREAC_23330, partial [Blastocatellia bacterium]
SPILLALVLTRTREYAKRDRSAFQPFENFEPTKERNNMVRTDKMTDQAHSEAAASLAYRSREAKHVLRTKKSFWGSRNEKPAAEHNATYIY